MQICDNDRCMLLHANWLFRHYVWCAVTYEVPDASTQIALHEVFPFF